MNFQRYRGVGAAYLALLTLLTLSSCGQTAPPPESTSSTTSTGVSTAAALVGVKPQENSCPFKAPVKGSTSSQGKIYYLLSSPNYFKVKPEICFPDAPAAEKAGYRAPKQQ